MSTIKVSTNKVSDPRLPNVSTSIEHEVPPTIADAIALLGEEVVRETFQAQYVVYLQATARRELARIWDQMSESERDQVLVASTKDEGQYTAVLPHEQQSELQSVMNEWKLGQRARRAPRQPVDVISSLAALLPTLDQAQKDEMAQKVAELLGKRLR